MPYTTQNGRSDYWAGKPCVSNAWPQESDKQAYFLGWHDAQKENAQRAQSDAAAYHAMSVRDNSKDRAWAEKLSAK